MKVIITDHEFPSIDIEREILTAAGIEVIELQCKSEDDLIMHCHSADALIVQWAPIDRRVLSSLKNCKAIVRYGIGLDNIDLAAAEEFGIPICNVPDYATGEVADHAVSMALTLARQLKLIDERFRQGVWSIVPDFPMPSFRDMLFVTIGFGRIARSVLQRAAAFGFCIGAHDPFVPEIEMGKHAVTPMGLDAAFEQADILSLHLPLTSKTRHIVDNSVLERMKSSAILVNTSRGALVDTGALASALTRGIIFSAGLDVFETEPLEKNHPILAAPRTILTSHNAWHSVASARRLQSMAAQEVLRALRNERLHNQVHFNQKAYVSTKR